MISERIEYQDGSVYQGQIVHGQRNGKEKFYISHVYVTKNQEGGGG